VALTGKRFATWEQLGTAVKVATTAWTAHRRPFI
jgi:hypothetical protein